MLPLLKLVSNGDEYKFNEVVETLSVQFALSEEEKNELLPSGQSFTFGSRVSWARTYLKKAGLLDSPRRAVIVITDRGTDALMQNLSKINVKFLKQFPEFVDFQTPKKGESGNVEVSR